MNVAVVGATGAVGQEFLTLLEARNFPLKNLRVLASKNSTGKSIQFRGEELVVEELKADSFRNIELAFFAAGASRSKEFVPLAVKSGCIVIDNSSAFRMEDKVPLVVPECNPSDVKKHQGIIANPNCSTIQMVVALYPIHKVSRIKKILVSTYQSVSGAGAKAAEELKQQTRETLAGQALTREIFPTSIAFNVIPHVDIFLENGETKEEWKMRVETQKIMHDAEIKINATCVRVPVLRAHSEAITISTESPLTADEVREILRKAPGVIVKDAHKDGGYPTPLEVTKTVATYVGRIREAECLENGINLWCVADQLYKGAALNSIQIAETLFGLDKHNS